MSTEVTQSGFAQSFMDLYRITDRQLGAGSYGRVHLAIDLFRRRQMACKMVALKDASQKRAGEKNFTKGLWREVNLLKEISHVRKTAPELTPTYSVQPNIIHVERVFYTDSNMYVVA